MSSRDRPRDDDLEERLDELEDVLSELRSDLRASERDRRRFPRSSAPRRNDEPNRDRDRESRREQDSRRTDDRRTDDSSNLPRPPRISELVRFTEQYTIPTVIALLETAIKSLKLVQGALRLLDPNRDPREITGGTGDRLSEVRDEATEGLARSLSELRTALTEADLPEEAASRSIIQEARDLTAEIEARIEEGRQQADAARDPNRRDRNDRDRGRRRDDPDRRRDDRDRPAETRRRDDRDRRESDDRRGRQDDAVRIDVTDPDTDRDGSRDAADEEAETEVGGDDTPDVDVESELDSIKRQLGAADDANADGPANNADADGPADDVDTPESTGEGEDDPDHDTP
ncbi:MAG: hypothetical protein PPP55_04260 [Halorubrum sp.]